MRDEDIVVTAAMRRYLAAFEAWLRNPTQETAVARFAALNVIAPERPDRVCKHGHGTRPWDQVDCRACNREAVRRYKQRRREISDHLAA